MSVCVCERVTSFTVDVVNLLVSDVSVFLCVSCHCISIRVLFHLFLNALLSLLIAFSLTEWAFDYRYHSNFCSLFSLSLFRSSFGWTWLVLPFE